ncbi:CAP domain-containing protein [Streptomyces sp. NPDC052292]|uniref:CAP domain-containing protein n=1 Tax=Streptomyces sp. NPDC052292 TaxID=3155053 RepID=UPI00342171AF
MFFEGSERGPEGRCPQDSNAHEARPDDFRFVLPHWGFPSDVGTSERHQIFDLVNMTRQHQPRPCASNLQIDLRLDGLAQAHSQDLAEHPGLWNKLTPDGWPGHYGSNGSLPIERIKWATGATGQENVAMQWATGNAPPALQAVLDSWMSDAAHKGTLLNCAFKATGIGFSVGHGKAPDGSGRDANFYYLTQDFI